MTAIAVAPTAVTVPEGWVTGAWTIDPAHTTVSFAVRHLMSRVRGTFTDVSGRIATETEPSQSRVTATIGVSSVSTGVQMRDDHLRSADFLDAERFPVMSFAGATLRPVRDEWVLSGDLTIRDITRSVDLAVAFLGVDPTGLQGETRIGFSARGTISRRDFGVTFGLAVDGTKIVVADHVDLVLDIEATLDA